MELPVKNLQGAVVDTIEVSDAVFAVPLNRAVVHQAMVAQLANRRVGTANAKTRAEVSGGGRKPWPQKGTGRARQGSIRSPQWVHGGVVHGPRPRDYHQDLPKKMRRLAIKGLLSEKLREGQLIVIDQLALDTHRTKEMVQALESLSIPRRCLLVSEHPGPGIFQAGRNLKQLKVAAAHTLNTLDLMDYDHLVISTDGVRCLEALWAKERPRHRQQRLQQGVEATWALETSAEDPGPGTPVSAEETTGVENKTPSTKKAKQSKTASAGALTEQADD